MSGEPFVMTHGARLTLGSAKVEFRGDLKDTAAAMQHTAIVRIDAEWCAQYFSAEMRLTLNGKEVD